MRSRKWLMAVIAASLMLCACGSRGDDFQRQPYPVPAAQLAPSEYGPEFKRIVQEGGKLTQYLGQRSELPGEAYWLNNKGKAVIYQTPSDGEYHTYLCALPSASPKDLQEALPEIRSRYLHLLANQSGQPVRVQVTIGGTLTTLACVTSRKGG